MKKKLEELNLLCTGCGACKNICPQNAISLDYDLQTDGGLVSIIDANNCIRCDRCVNVCPLIQKNTKFAIPRLEPEVYALWADEETRHISSSGGVFSLLANVVLEEQGYVCAVKYGKDFRAIHSITNNKDCLKDYRRSKYMQSDTGYVYREIKSLLDQKKEVLFVGCPCQVAGLKSFLGTYYESLLTVDVFCTHAPSYWLFKQYLAENYEICKIKSIDFRTKTFGWVCDVCEIEHTNDETIYLREYNDAYLKAYHSRLSMRKVCENCKFSGFPRQGDLSIADFWGIENYDKTLNDGKGTSCVVINTSKGKEFFDKIKGKTTLVEKVPMKYLEYNRLPNLYAHSARDRFYRIVKNKPFNNAVDAALNDKYDIALWGLWTERNFGSELTYFALYKILKSMELEVLLVERPLDAPWGPNKAPVLFKNCPYFADEMRFEFPNKTSMKNLNNCCRIAMVGSDQIWHWDLYKSFGSVSYLDYIYNSRKKIAYASSFGREFWDGSEEETAEISIYLKDFDFISVREKSAVSICKEIFGVEAVQVLDPVFLCEPSEYQKLALTSELILPEHYIGAYLLDSDDRKTNVLRQAEDYFGLTSSIITDAFETSDSFKSEDSALKKIYNEDWLKNIICADFVITDSFHGVCFSIIFQKQFVAITNPKRGSIRFKDLLASLSLSDRLITNSNTDIKHLLAEKIDYAKVSIILEHQRKISVDWLKKSIYSDKTKRLSHYDILKKTADEMEKMVLDGKEELLQQLSYLKGDLEINSKNITWLDNRLNGCEGAVKWHGERLNESELNSKHYEIMIADNANRLATLSDSLSDIILEFNRLNEQYKGLNQQVQELLEINGQTKQSTLELQAKIERIEGEIEKLQMGWLKKLVQKLKKYIQK